MKNILKIFLLALLTSPLLAQTPPEHRLWIGINAAPALTSSGAFSVTPRVGYWLTNRVLAGVEGRFGKDVGNVRLAGAGVFGRYYIGNGKVQLFPHLGIGLDRYRQEGVVQASSVVLRPGLGLQFGRLTNRFGVELLVEKPFGFNDRAVKLGNLKNEYAISLGLRFRF